MIGSKTELLGALRQTVLGWEDVYAWNDETFGLDSMLGRADCLMSGEIAV